ncbi:unnamed protein product [Dibothriocephalus latus]|uniref:Uncharacterized protein n=1 Tax=Dibothriocephalus latus TaxID=60516 RepID=A0A3P7NC24_DIBLA|nr:unnamed protein product [Dibothriocephalus latus]
MVIITIDMDLCLCHRQFLPQLYESIQRIIYKASEQKEFIQSCVPPFFKSTKDFLFAGDLDANLICMFTSRVGVCVKFVFYALHM